MLGGREREIREPELPQAPQTLHRHRIQERDLPIVELDEMVDRIEDALHVHPPSHPSYRIVRPCTRSGLGPASAEGHCVLIVLKYGGNAMATPGDADPLLDDIVERARAGDRIVLVHGGGPQIDAALAERHIVTQRIDGQRVTDAATLAVTEAVLCGSVNKALVRELARRGVPAAGISGQDGNLLEARRLCSASGESLGFVGDIVLVRPALLEALLEGGFIPVVAPLGLETGSGSALNINADASAGAIAGALHADAYVVVTNVERVRRVLDDPSTGLDRVSPAQAQAFLDDGTFDGGMRPKIQSALAALASGARSAIVCGGGAGALSGALAGNGTIIADG
jgi:acetylglutamate kinase